MQNKAKFQEIINRNIANYLDPMDKRVKNVVKLNSGNTIAHEMKKAEIAYNCLKDGLTFFCEAKLKNNKRPDILVMCTNTPICYEVAVSESEESLIRKAEETYMGIRVIPVRVW